jgi:hypothetical protein
VDLTTTTCVALTPEGTEQAVTGAGFGLGFGEGLDVLGRALDGVLDGVGVEAGLRAVVAEVGFGRNVVVVVGELGPVVGPVVEVVVEVLVEVVDVGGAASSFPDPHATSSGTRASHAAYLRLALGRLVLDRLTRVAWLTGRSAGSRGWPTSRPSAGPGS